MNGNCQVLVDGNLVGDLDTLDFAKVCDAGERAEGPAGALGLTLAAPAARDHPEKRR